MRPRRRSSARTSSGRWRDRELIAREPMPSLTRAGAGRARPWGHGLPVAQVQACDTAASPPCDTGCGESGIRLLGSNHATAVGQVIRTKLPGSGIAQRAPSPPISRVCLGRPARGACHRRDEVNVNIAIQRGIIEDWGRSGGSLQQPHCHGDRLPIAGLTEVHRAWNPCRQGRFRMDRRETLADSAGRVSPCGSRRHKIIDD